VGSYRSAAVRTWRCSRRVRGGPVVGSGHQDGAYAWDLGSSPRPVDIGEGRQFLQVGPGRHRALAVADPWLPVDPSGVVPPGQVTQHPAVRDEFARNDPRHGSRGRSVPEQCPAARELAAVGSEHRTQGKPKPARSPIRSSGRCAVQVKNWLVRLESHGPAAARFRNM
jgi:hypothetical protein